MHALLFALVLSAEADAAPIPDAAPRIDAAPLIDATPLIEATPLTDATPPANFLPGFAIARVRTHQPVVALTFDACATLKQDNGFDREVFDILKREQIAITVFATGRWIEAHPAEAKELAAEAWIEFGNHSYSHARMTRIPRRKAREQIARTETIIAGLGRRSVAFRPPAGAWNRSVVRMAAKWHLPTVEWDVISGDAGGHIGAQKIVATVLSAAKAGSIIIFHINGRAPHAKEALPDIIRGLREKGLGFVTVPDLLHEPDAQPVSSRPAPFGYRPLRGGKRGPGKGIVDARPSG
ncbi:MAG TPA: polysaccharide deacetylase family protein [Polyangia bacterium]|nr:polysaccharide deacetylase family protein [Polyangia bacterium]